jgi:hypothetical protein
MLLVRATRADKNKDSGPAWQPTRSVARANQLLASEPLSHLHPRPELNDARWRVRK